MRSFWKRAARGIDGPSCRSRNGCRVCLLIDVAAMAEVDDHDGEDSVIDPVQDPVVAGSDSPFGSCHELLCRRRPRVLGEEVDGSLDATFRFRRQLSERTSCRWQDLDFVAAHGVRTGAVLTKPLPADLPITRGRGRA